MNNQSVPPETLEIHPANEQLAGSRMGPKQFKEFAESMEKGQEMPVLVLEGTNQIIDGWHRWTVCKDLGMDVDIDYVVCDDLPEFMYKLNVMRKERLKKMQQVALASDSATNPRGKGGDRNPEGSNQWSNAAPRLATEKTVKEAAEDFGVGERTINEFREVEAASPELAQEIREGKKAVGTALKEVKAAANAPASQENKDTKSEAKPKPKRTAEDVFDELTKRDQKLVDKHVMALVDKVRKAAEEEYKTRATGLNTDETAVMRKRKQLEVDRRLVSMPFTHREYKLILGLLHPDKHTGKEERAQKAFDIFKKVEHVCRRVVA